MVAQPRIIRVFGLLGIAFASGAWANPVINPLYPDFTLVSLGTITGVPSSYQIDSLGFNGSALMVAGQDLNASSGFQTIYSATAVRGGSGAISGFGSASPYASLQVALPSGCTVSTAPGCSTSPPGGNSFAGGLLFAPNGTLLYTTGSQSNIGQYVPGTGTSSLTAVGNGMFLGGLNYLNGVLVATDNSGGGWYQVTLTPGSNGVYGISLGSTPLSNAPADSFASVPAGFGGTGPGGGVLVGDSLSNSIMLYSQNAIYSNGMGTAIVTDSSSPNVDGYALVEDPNHPNSYLFTTSGNQIYELDLTAPEPSAAALAFGGIVLFLSVRRKPNG